MLQCTTNFQYKRGELDFQSAKKIRFQQYSNKLKLIKSFKVQILQDDIIQTKADVPVDTQQKSIWPTLEQLKKLQNYKLDKEDKQIISSDNSTEQSQNIIIQDPVQQKIQTQKQQQSEQIYNKQEQNVIQKQWQHLQRWASLFKKFDNEKFQLMDISKPVVITGGGSFGTALGSALAWSRPDLEIVMLVRDKLVADNINTQHRHLKYLKQYDLPHNLKASTDIESNIRNCQGLVHSLPVQVSRQYFQRIKDVLPWEVPVISVSKGLEIATAKSMHQIIKEELGSNKKMVFLSGPSFAQEVIEQKPTAIVAASDDIELAKQVQGIFACKNLRVNVTTDIVGVESCGALKNVLAIAAGIVEGLGLGHNAMAAVVAQGCNEIKWLCERMGARADTVSSLAGLGDIMLTCYVNLSRNRSLGVRLGQGESLNDILASSTQVAEGVATAGSVVILARLYKVQLPILTCVVKILNNDITPMQAVELMMSLPQIEEQVSAPIPSSLKYRWLLQELDTLDYSQNHNGPQKLVLDKDQSHDHVGGINKNEDHSKVNKEIISDSSKVLSQN